MGIRLVIVRHAESRWNRAGRWQGQGGTGLTGAGHGQAAATGSHLAQRFGDVALVARSDLQRVRETAAPFERRAAVPIVVDRRLRELDVGTWSGLTHAQARAADPAGYAAFTAGRDVPVGGAERLVDLRARVVAALDDVRGLIMALGGGTAIIVTHGWPVRAATAALSGRGPGSERDLAPVGNCAVTVLEAAGEGFRVTCYGDQRHLKVADQLATRGGSAGA